MLRRRRLVKSLQVRGLQPFHVARSQSLLNLHLSGVLKYFLRFWSDRLVNWVVNHPFALLANALILIHSRYKTLAHYFFAHFARRRYIHSYWFGESAFRLEG